MTKKRGDTMPMRNREKLMEQSIYDLLCSIHKRAMPHRCVLQLIDDKERARTRCDRYEENIQRVFHQNTDVAISALPII